MALSILVNDMDFDSLKFVSVYLMAILFWINYFQVFMIFMTYADDRHNLLTYKQRINMQCLI